MSNMFTLVSDEAGVPRTADPLRRALTIRDGPARGIVSYGHIETLAFGHGPKPRPRSLRRAVSSSGQCDRSIVCGEQAVRDVAARGPGLNQEGAQWSFVTDSGRQDDLRRYPPILCRHWGFSCLRARSSSSDRCPSRR
jgi:hypothetical protein